MAHRTHFTIVVRSEGSTNAHVLCLKEEMTLGKQSQSTFQMEGYTAIQLIWSALMSNASLLPSKLPLWTSAT